MNSSSKSKRFSRRLAEFSIRNRVWLLIAILIVTVVLGYFAFQIEVGTRFEDLLPEHPYIEVHQEYKENFGGANVINILLEVQGEGTIFQKDVLKKIKRVTRDLREVSGVNPTTIKSLASKRVQQVSATAYQIAVVPFMFPEVPKTKQEIQQLKQDVRGSPQVYGVYVARDMKSAQISADFYADRLEPVTVFKEVRQLMNKVESENVKLSVIGNPVLFGWVNYYLNETLVIVIVSLILVGLVVLLFVRTIWGSLVPLLATFISSMWALGVAQLMGLHFDPLVVVIVFLIMARVVSACIQSIVRFQEEMAKDDLSSREAAKRTLTAKWTPGVLAVVTDAGAFLIVYLTPIPLLQKIALIGFIWLITIPVTSILLTNLILSYATDINDQKVVPFAIERLLNPLVDSFRYLASGRGRYMVLGVLVLLLGVSGFYAFQITVGDARAGSPILWPESEYNRTVEKINQNFLGSNKLFVVFTGKEKGVIKEPEVLRTMQTFQRFVGGQAEVGGSISLANILPNINRTLNEGDPRFLQLGNTAAINGELLFFFVDSPEALSGLSDESITDGAVTVYFTDHKGSTIRTGMQRIKSFVDANPMEHADYELVGGKIGVLAATNEVIRKTEAQSIALALLLALILCALTYSQPLAGLYLIIPLLLANAVTYGYMAWYDIGLNINSVPVAALGIGLGIDYAIYVADEMRSGYAETGGMSNALTEALRGSGKSVIVTVVVLAVSIVPFLFSSLRFQAEMALLIALWMVIAAFGAVVIIPSLVTTFKPAFIISDSESDSESEDATNPDVK